jgi:chemotaxis family two-component system sensor kinase Cph1
MREVHLKQLLQNLVSNAIKYRGDNSPRVNVSAAQLADVWQFAVEDNGIGIAPEYKERIFGVFKRLHANGNYSGTGIGLAICKRLVERYDGRIWVESQPGEGATFYFTIREPDRTPS